MTALVIPSSGAYGGSMADAGRRFVVSRVPPSPGVIGDSQPVFGTTSSPGVIGEGRKITKTSNLVPHSSFQTFPEPRQCVNDDINNNNDAFTAGSNARPSKGQPSMRARQLVASQQNPYQTVPSGASQNYDYTSFNQLWQKGVAADDHALGQAGFQHPMFSNNHFTRQPLIPEAWSEPVIQQQNSDDEDDDDMDGNGSSHANTFPVEIEHHSSKQCLYRRQQSKSGYMRKAIGTPMFPGADPMQIKYYRKDLVRVCKCNSSASLEAALPHGLEYDMDGYEIHYSQKCKWKAYDDFKTGKRVLIRLCKCYKPVV